MKKLALLFSCVFVFVACDLEDEEPWKVPVYAEVTDVDLPESFEMGETYEIDVTYLLPSACHEAAGLDVERGGSAGEEYREIYIAGVATIYSDQTECTEEEEDLSSTSDFTLTINVEEPYTFYLWQGVDEENKNIFTTIEVPVIAEEEEEEEATED